MMATTPWAEFEAELQALDWANDSVGVHRAVLQACAHAAVAEPRTRALWEKYSPIPDLPYAMPVVFSMLGVGRDAARLVVRGSMLVLQVTHDSRDWIDVTRYTRHSFFEARKHTTAALLGAAKREEAQ